LILPTGKLKVPKIFEKKISKVMILKISEFSKALQNQKKWNKFRALKNRDVSMKKEVKVLLGDPKKAVLKISWPMMLGMLVQSLYNFADGAWVAGLGTDQLSAIGLFFPFFMILVAVGMGLGVGGGSAISRRIGERNKQEAAYADFWCRYFPNFEFAAVALFKTPVCYFFQQ
jgi:hypothetical protein